MSDGYALDPGELTRAGETLGSVASSVQARVGAVRVRPDAGQSSDEVAQAFGGLAQELQALTDAASRLGDEVQAALTTYQQTDRGVADQYRGVLPR